MLCQKLKVLENQRTIALIVLLIITFSATTSFALALFFKPAQKPLEPLGYLTTVVKVNNVTDVYGWQIGLNFNASNMKVVSINPGSFLAKQRFNYTLGHSELNYTETGTFFTFNLKLPNNDTLVIGQSLLREKSGVSGSGDLVIIVFAYYEYYERPKLIFEGADDCRVMLVKYDAELEDAVEVPLTENMITVEYLP